jgi:hypothetical protein
MVKDATAAACTPDHLGSRPCTAPVSCTCTLLACSTDTTCGISLKQSHRDSGLPAPLNTCQPVITLPPSLLHCLSCVSLSLYILPLPLPLPG